MRHLENCPICSEKNRKIIYAGTINFEKVNDAIKNPYGSHYQINRCSGCELLYSDPILDEDQIELLYLDAESTNITAGEEGNVRETMRLYYQFFSPYLKNREAILDVGCDVGLLLEFAKEDRFSNLYGIEPNPVARKIANSKINATITDEFYEKDRYEKNSFDAITFVHVVDHVINPAKVIESAYEHLKPGGIAFVVVHNSNSILAKIMGEKFPPFNLYHHFFFTKESLRNLFESRGFEVLKVSPTKNCYSINFFIERFPGCPGKFKKILKNIANQLRIGKIPLTFSVGNIGIVARKKS